MSYTNIPSQYIRTELTPANIKQALLDLYNYAAEQQDIAIAGKDWLADYLHTDDSCDTNTREDLFQHFFTLDLAVDYIWREAETISVRTWKNIHGKDDSTKFSVQYNIDNEFYFQHYDRSNDSGKAEYHDEATVLENIQEILYNRAASASTFHDQCE